MIPRLRETVSSKLDGLRTIRWEIFTLPADRGLLLGLNTGHRSDESTGDAIVDEVRWLLPEDEYGLQILRTYAAPGMSASDLRAHFVKLVEKRLPRKAERLLLIIEGFDLLESPERLAHLAAFRLGLRIPHVVILVSSAGFQQRECRFFDRVA